MWTRDDNVDLECRILRRENPRATIARWDGGYVVRSRINGHHVTYTETEESTVASILNVADIEQPTAEDWAWLRGGV